MKYFVYFSTKTYVVGTQKKGSFEHPQYMFGLSRKKIILFFASSYSVSGASEANYSFIT